MKSWNDASGGTVPSLIAPPRRHPACANGRGIRIRALALTLATCMLVFAVDAWFPDVKNGHLPTWKTSDGGKTRAKPFDWSQIEASEDLQFHKCFNGYECAKLKVPFDYNNGTHPNASVSIAIAKLPAVVPVEDQRYAGPILLNPGGPGGPGALFTLGVGRNIQHIVDAEPHLGLEPSEMRYYDIIGFDPRGIGWTEPHAQCMDDAATWSWTLREGEEGILGSSDAALGRLWSMTHAWGTSCAKSVEVEDGPDIKQYMTTALVARDMLEIVERHATWVSQQMAKRQYPYDISARHKPDTALYKPKEAKLQYWGFSYGTFLGSTFASMFPDRVGRFVLDGVVSSYDYLHSLGNGSLTDNQKAIDSFYTYCFNSGPEGCPLTTSNSTVSDVKDRVESILESIYHNPLALNSPLGPEILTYSDVKSFFFSAAYSPQPGFPMIASLLADIEAGQGDVLDQIQQSSRYRHIYSCGSHPEFNFADSTPTYSILCSDGIDQTHNTMDEFAEYWKLLDSISPTSGAIWSMLRMRCTAWKITSPTSFPGPFGANTSTPILFLSNTADPVTPLRSARLMHALFPNSGLLVSDTAGHCSLAQPSSCVMDRVKIYFQSALLPRTNTLCVPPASAFSLNSTDPHSPFYDPGLEGMRAEQSAGETGPGADLGDLFGVDRLVGERGLVGGMRRVMLEKYGG
ncbi:TAP-like protein-domain-containing protein [Ampelomyces quisqualis]|uniref:TAP-like protein-domain-containing protein n=1 Tax=Ampelomyces quisqualis TaxID=50730 RepID=A0A6A5QAF1_AMPQU|nr:TAP-like protein-domain-containing protein [Ampelomyces quisqualis]